MKLAAVESSSRLLSLKHDNLLTATFARDTYQPSYRGMSLGFCVQTVFLLNF